MRGIIARFTLILGRRRGLLQSFRDSSRRTRGSRRRAPRGGDRRLGESAYVLCRWYRRSEPARTAAGDGRRNSAISREEAQMAGNASDWPVSGMRRRTFLKVVGGGAAWSWGGRFIGAQPRTVSAATPETQLFIGT